MSGKRQMIMLDKVREPSRHTVIRKLDCKHSTGKQRKVSMLRTRNEGQVSERRLPARQCLRHFHTPGLV